MSETPFVPSNPSTGEPGVPALPTVQPRVFTPRILVLREQGYVSEFGSVNRVILPFQFPSAGRITFRKYWMLRNPVFKPGPSGRLLGTIPLVGSEYSSFSVYNGSLELRRTIIRRLFVSSSKTSLFANSRVQFLSFGPAFSGALTEFAFWDGDSPDPAINIVHSVSSGAIGGVGQSWTRHSATVTLPEEARYVGVGGRFFDVPSSDTAFFNVKNVMLQTADLARSYPTNFESARQIKADIVPERINWSTNPAFWNNVTNWTGVSRIADVSVRSGFTGMTTVASGATTQVKHSVPLLKANRKYRAQVSIRAAEPLNVSVRSSGSSSENTSGLYIPPTNATETSPGSGMYPPNTLVESPVGSGLYETGGLATPGTVRVIEKTSADSVQRGVVSYWFVFQPNYDGTADLEFLINKVNSGITTVVNLYEMLVEEYSNQTYSKPYFDGSTSGEYVWKTGGITGSTQSMYYKNRLERYAATKRILADNAPLGVGQGVPSFGVIPGVPATISQVVFVNGLTYPLVYPMNYTV